MEPGRINTRILYDNIMNKFKWGNMADPSVYLDEDHRRLTVSFRNIFQRLARTLIQENQPEKAITVLDKAMEVMPEYNVPYNYFTLLLAENYYAAGELLEEKDDPSLARDAYDKANDISYRMLEIHEENLNYYFRFRGDRAEAVRNNIRESLTMIQQIHYTAELYRQKDLAEQAEDAFYFYYEIWLGR